MIIAISYLGGFHFRVSGLKETEEKGIKVVLKSYIITRIDKQRLYGI